MWSKYMTTLKHDACFCGFPCHITMCSSNASNFWIWNTYNSKGVRVRYNMIRVRRIFIEFLGNCDRYSLFWIVVLISKFAFTMNFQVSIMSAYALWLPLFCKGIVCYLKYFPYPLLYCLYSASVLVLIVEEVSNLSFCPYCRRSCPWWNPQDSLSDLRISRTRGIVLSRRVGFFIKSIVLKLVSFQSIYWSHNSQYLACVDGVCWC